jgi:DUF971 family protein
MHPTEVRLCSDRTHLSIVWENGVTVAYPAPLLREHTRDASSIRFAVDGWSVPASRDLTIRNVEPIGNYAVRLEFSDGHDRGIFPWVYLSEIAAQAELPSEPMPSEGNCHG